MPRPKLARRQPCDCRDCLETPQQQSSTVQSAIARQEPPPKSLVVVVLGGLALGLHKASLPHLHAAAREGWTGLLACRAGGPPPVSQLLGVPAAGSAARVALLPER